MMRWYGGSATKSTSSSGEELLEPANFNSPGQIVIAGHKNAVLRGMELAKTKGRQAGNVVACQRSFTLLADEARQPTKMREKSGDGPAWKTGSFVVA